MPESVTVRLIVGAKVMLSVSTEFDADIDLPFDNISETWNEAPIVGNNSPLIASDASVMGRFDGAVMVYVIVKVLGPVPIALPIDWNESPGLLVVRIGSTPGKNDGSIKLLGATSVSVIPLIVLSSTVQPAWAPPEK